MGEGIKVGGNREVLLDGVKYEEPLKFAHDFLQYYVAKEPKQCNDSSGVTFDNAIHLLGGGNTASTYKQHYKRDGSAWTSVSTLPYELIGFDRAVVFDNALHIISSGRKNYSKMHYKWDGSAWTSVSTLPVALSNPVVFRGELYGITTSKLYKFDGSTWIEISTLPTSTNEVDKSLVVFEDAIHFLANQKHYKFDGSAWTILSTPKAYSKCIVFNNKIHAFKGIAHYEWDGTTWTRKLDLLSTYASIYWTVLFQDCIHLMSDYTDDGLYDSSLYKLRQVYFLED